MAFVTTFHLQASADAALSCKPGQPVTRGGCELELFLPTVRPNCASLRPNSYGQAVLISNTWSQIEPR